MLKEERALRDVTCGKRDSITGGIYYPVFPPMRISRLITAFRRAIYEDAAKECELGNSAAMITNAGAFYAEVIRQKAKIREGK